LMQYSKDSARNLMLGQTVTANASSTINDSWKASFAVDNLQARGWASKDDDPMPTLTLELERPVRATQILFSRAKVSDDRKARIERVAVTLNGKGPPIEVELVPDDQRKTKLRLPQAVIVRKLEIKVTAATKVESPLKSVGFAEIELQAEKPGEKQ